MPNVFVTSDTHFGHANILTFLKSDGTKLRPWDAVEEMDAALIKNWNDVVKPHDKIYHLGDIAINKKSLDVLAQLNGDKFLKRLSNAALESLAIIAYKQPITKGEVEAIRGVNSDYSIQKLLEKELIVISGRNEHLPGKPLVYGTSKNFMDYFGINSTDDLPKIREVLADQIVEATVIKPEDFTDNSVFEQIADANQEARDQEETPNLPEEEA